MSKTIGLLIKRIFFITSILTIILNFSPLSSAGLLDRIYDADYELVIEVDEDAANNPFLPVDMVIEIPLTFKLNFYGRYDEEMAPYYDIGSIIYLSVNKTPDWASATISPKTTIMQVSNEVIERTMNLSIKVDKKAIPFRKGEVELRVDIEKLGAINARTFNIEIPFKPGYFPMLDIDTNKNIKKINPQDTADFFIDIENKGNAKTKVNFKVVNLSEDWSADITSNLVLSTEALGQENKGRVSLTIKPPYDFGYHDDRSIIDVEVTPIYYGNESVIGQKYILSFIVQSKGVSTPGFEILTFFIVVFIFSTFILKKTSWKKVRNKKQNLQEDK